MASVGTSAGIPTDMTGSTLRLRCRDVTFSSSYTTGGESLTFAQLSFGTVWGAHCTIKSPAGSVTSVWYDVANQKLKAFTATAEVANATNLAALVVEVVAYGRD